MSKSTIPIEEQSTDRLVAMRPHFLASATHVRLLPRVILVMMLSGLLLLDAILPLKGLSFESALLSHLSSWVLLPTHLLFPHLPTSGPLTAGPLPHPLGISLSWWEATLLPGIILLMFLLYALALYTLPRIIHLRYLIYSTLLLGIVCLFFPVVTSSDAFSYIAYAHMEVIYHLNPLITAPSVLHGDLILKYVYWKDQPSAYGPTWVVITGFLQWLLGLTGSDGILRMLFTLRVLGLSAHIGSTLLIWSISGQLQRITGDIAPEKRMRVVLAFAWNPLLLFEACVNAHNDAVLLFLILLTFWFLLHGPQLSLKWLLPAAVVLALATCLKINILIFVPGLLLFLWMQRPRKVFRLLFISAVYCGVIVLLYMPFWQHGAVLHVLSVNPSTSRVINSPYDFLSQLYNALMHVPIHLNAAGEAVATPVERLMHMLSVLIFVPVYAILCRRATGRAWRINTIPGLIRWMALVWLLYCAIGSPWFWPWYLVTFFGLYALVASCTREKYWGGLNIPLAVGLLAFSSLSLYSFYAWAPAHVSIPDLSGFFWVDLRGLWIWLIPFLALLWPSLRTLAKLPQLCRGFFTQRVRASTFSR
ncbi:MAG TPA: hypothetical protein VFA09_02235 [Ktedonobacteraceae bacterium]|nr:hypothetical protein [Ktedonobacteraceae bacterium]